MIGDPQSIRLVQNGVAPSSLTGTNKMHLRWRFFFAALILTIVAIFFYWLLFAQSPRQQYGGYYDSPDYMNGVEGTAKNPSVLILMWTRVFREQSFDLSTSCPYYNRCIFSYDHRDFSQADAVIFHVPDIKWTYTLHSNEMAFDLPEMPDLPLNPSSVKAAVNVFMSHENPSTLAELYKFKDLGVTAQNFFHWTMTHLHSSDLPMPYGGYWLSPEETRLWGFSPVQIPFDRQTILKDKKTKGIVWFVSNCHSHSKRELAVEALSKYIPISIGGKCAKTAEGKHLCPRDASCDHLFAEHFFFIAAENDICRDYITEKYWNRYQLPSVPIVLRKHIYDGRIPDNSYIAMDQFESPKAMADHLHFLMNNTDEYLKYFEWRSQNWSIAPWYNENFLMGPCALCKRLLSANSPLRPAPMESVVEWFERESQCEGGAFAQKWSKM